ncbi:hypothetical protein [Streptomyces tritici]|uniref:hypothetical protein n=1 Tax=Streptomyces tritici TaxID=2054410 RepID=UPI003AF02421
MTGVKGHPVSRLQRLAWGAAALAGVVGAYAASWLVASARSYCDAGWEPPHRFAHGFEWVVLTVAAAALAVGAAVLARWATVRGPRSVRASAQVGVVLLVVAALAWWYLGAQATPDGYPGDSGLCPANNVPPWWPGWFPS